MCHLRRVSWGNSCSLKISVLLVTNYDVFFSYTKLNRITIKVGRGGRA